MSIFHVPLNMVQRVKHASAMIAAAGAAPLERPLFLGEEISPWKSNIYLEVTHYVPEANMVRLSGTFVPKVFKGPFRDASKWMEAMQNFVSGRGQKVERILVGYTTCPKCSKAYGENYVVLYAQIASAESQRPPA
jgi:hypothetical protein